ncbi:hypothetical protein [Sansalvadorimonas verongulae]|uniref:hypothetical protein n=1 Tax=Sansalvadorimonas verongulae TaxID=2172824 RepID=UPI0012BC565A|nr:hypothetical protein [Sansalvadorimonas verongulae]MTI15584.1 hypothetical protein [Sansalvadorimonas verongulae]
MEQSLIQAVQISVSLGVWPVLVAAMRTSRQQRIYLMKSVVSSSEKIQAGAVFSNKMINYSNPGRYNAGSLRRR